MFKISLTINKLKTKPLKIIGQRNPPKKVTVKTSIIGKTIMGGKKQLGITLDCDLKTLFFCHQKHEKPKAHR